MPAAAPPKKCTKCGETKPAAAFRPEPLNRTGLSSWCRRCKNTASHQSAKRDPAKLKAKQSRADAKRAGTPAHRRQDRRAQLRYHYGLEEEDFERMREAQGGRCKICKRVPDKTLVVDHCHTTGRVRGLLCRVCNSAIGLLNDDPALLRNAIAHIEMEPTLAR